jgi:hypothetical protein
MLGVKAIFSICVIYMLTFRIHNNAVQSSDPRRCPFEGRAWLGICGLRCELTDLFVMVCLLPHIETFHCK